MAVAMARRMPRVVERPALGVERQIGDERRRRHEEAQIGVQAHERQVVVRRAAG